jgi:hypothetical protein
MTKQRVTSLVRHPLTSRSHGDFESAERAEQVLSEKVDTDHDADLLAELQVDAQRLEDDFGGQSPVVG